MNSQADIDVLAVGTFTAEISEQSSPPFTPQSFPIIVTIVGSINARVLPGPHGQGEAFAGATVRATGGFEIDQTFEVSTTNGNETVPILQSLARNCSAGCSIEFSKGAAVETFASVLAPAHLAGSSFATAEAVIDPFLAFDQAAFDQIHGPNSFVLEDFYVFTFSPNLSAPVPALSQWGRLALVV